MPTEYDGLRRDIEELRQEIATLRKWRHADVTPALLAAAKLASLVESVGGRCDELERRYAETEKAVAEMVEADKIAAAIAEAIQRRGRGILTRWQAALGIAVGLAALGAFALQIWLATN